MEGRTKPNYANCVKISTDASLKEMIPPGGLVLVTPLIVGTFLGVETLAGLLAGSLVSGVQVAISASNTGGAWDNAKKYIEVCTGAKSEQQSKLAARKILEVFVHGGMESRNRKEYDMSSYNLD